MTRWEIWIDVAVHSKCLFTDDLALVLGFSGVTSVSASRVFLVNSDASTNCEFLWSGCWVILLGLTNITVARVTDLLRVPFFLGDALSIQNSHTFILDWPALVLCATDLVTSRKICRFTVAWGRCGENTITIAVAFTASGARCSICCLDLCESLSHGGSLSESTNSAESDKNEDRCFHCL